jgi:hypothetical protein
MLAMKTEPSEQTPLSFAWRRASAIIASAGVFWLTGCTSLRPSDQRLVAKPNMTFSDSATLVYNSSRLFPQLASGFASAGGTQNSGCTSCR